MPTFLPQYWRMNLGSHACEASYLLSFVPISSQTLVFISTGPSPTVLLLYSPMIYTWCIHVEVVVFFPIMPHENTACDEISGLHQQLLIR